MWKLNLGESLENYLEAIYILKHKYGVVRSVDVARYMGFSKPSISHAVKELRKKEYLCLDDSGNLVLTDKGIEMASKTYEKHCFFKKSFIDVGVDPQVAEKEACKIEHAISDESFNKIKKYYEKKWNGPESISLAGREHRKCV